LGARKAVLNDLSPAAAFIAYNYNSPVDAAAFERDENRILRDVEKECGWMYETWHPNYSATNRVKGKINYVVWADVFICPHCGFESNFWDVAVDKNTWQVVDNWKCPKCSILLSKEGQKDGGAIKAERAWETYFDTYLGQTLRRVKQEPAFINYIVGKKRYNKLPDIKDKELVEKIENTPIPYQIPLTKLPLGDKTGDPKNVGVTHAHHFYTKRNLYVLSSFANRLGSPNKYIDIISIASIITKMYRFRSQNSSLGAGGGPLSGTLYIPSLSKEIPILKSLKEHISKSHKVIKKLSKLSNNLINTGSHTTIISIPSNSVDYIFTDPPFGSNLMYSELNFLWESWLRVFTSNKSEAIINNTQKKKLQDYQILMSMSFTEAFRILKPDHWITVEFHNSKNTVWNAIQEALLQAGFVIADVRVFDKRQGSYNQVNSTGAVKQDLIISAYKPNSTLEERALLKDGSEESAWIFIHDHLNKLPTLNEVNGQLIVNAERQSFLLFDRMVAFHVQRGILVPMSSGEFYAGLSHRYPERDGMYFLPGQVGEYDQARLQVQQVQQLQLFVTDESTAILWLRQQLESYPQSYQDLFPKFIRETNVWEKHEKSLELSEILEQNFLSYEGGGPIPEQIWEWMLRDDEMRDAVKGQNRENASNHVQTLAKGRWFVPDPNNSKQLEKIRERALLKEFEGYKVYPGNKLKVFRIEAVRAGFRKAWQERDYKIIIAVAEKISEEALQQDPKLLMWYDQALTRLEQ
jgi:rubredoxin